MDKFKRSPKIPDYVPDWFIDAKREEWTDESILNKIREQYKEYTENDEIIEIASRSLFKVYSDLYSKYK